MTQGYAQDLFTKAAADKGLHPFPRPSANLSEAYTNTYGCRMAPCTYCGFCERFGCANYSKSSPQTCVLPVLDARARVRGAHGVRSDQGRAVRRTASARPA